MAQLFDTIRRLVSEGRYVVGEHAAQRLEDRGILEWQVVDGIDGATLDRERPDASPNATVELLQTLPDGAPVKVVWSHLRTVDAAKLVTVHYLR